MNTKDKGILVEAHFKLRALQRGWIISQPFGDNAPYDFIVDNGVELLKVQCKHMNLYKGAYRLPVASRVGAKRLGYCSYRGKVDFMFGFNLEDNTSVWIHIDDCNSCEMSFKRSRASINTNLVEDYQI